MNIILGPPGTGKTTRLLGLVEQYLAAGVPPDRIGYFSFTRRAAHEAISRAKEKFGTDDKAFPHFRTLHSLAFRQMGISSKNIMTSKHYDEVSNWLKIPNFNGQYHIEDAPFVDFGYGDKYLQTINMARICCIPLRDVYNQSEVSLQVNWSELEWVARSLEDFKKKHELFDYSDILEQFVVQELPPRLEVAFIDEAQDLSPIQWKMVHLIEKCAETTYIAGDDDQAIYRWAGADVDYFIRLDGNIEVLQQSYRIPSSHHDISQRLINRIGSRRPKIFQPRPESGVVMWHPDSSGVDLSEGNWLLLGRTRAMIKRMEEEVQAKGHLYTTKLGGAEKSDIFSAIEIWERLRGGGDASVDEVRLAYKYMDKSQVTHGFKTMPNADEEKRYTIRDLISDFGLLHSLPWPVGLPRIPQETRVYLEACVKKGEDIGSKPRIHLSTIHGAKGAEADNVLLLTDFNHPNERKMRYNPNLIDDEKRVFYVGLTRAKQNLHLIHPMTTGGFRI